MNETRQSAVTDGGGEPESGDYHVFYAAAHHDLWWAKTQMWAAAQWALVLDGVLVGAAALVHKDTFPIDPPSAAWPFVALATVVTVLTECYLGRLHWDVARNRANVAFIGGRRPEMKKVFGRLPKHGDESSDPWRGWWFVVILQAVLGGGLGFADFIVVKQASCGWILALITSIIGAAATAVAIWLLGGFTPRDQRSSDGSA